MYKLLLWLCLIALAQHGSMQSTLSPYVIKDIFGTPSPNDIGDTQSSYTPCTTEDGESGKCVNFYQCDSNKQISEDGANIFNKRSHDGCVSYKETCCLVPNTRDPTDLIEPSETEPTPEECGWRKPNGVGNNSGDESDKDTKFGEFPWVVAVLKIVPDNEPDGELMYLYAGGGSLIHREVVLTAAHIVTGNHATVIRAGEWDTQTTEEPLPHQEREVKKIVTHKKFNADNLHYDIALLFLSEPFDLAPNVGLVCLPPPRQRATAGTSCIVAGWGKDKFGKEGYIRALLRKVEVPVVEHTECQDALRQTRLGYYFRLDSSFMCAGGDPGEDACEGDGGAPLVCPIEAEEDRYTQNGIVSWGIGCGDTGNPGVYVDVAFLRPWIDDQMFFRKLNPEVYIHKIKAPEVVLTGTRHLSSNGRKTNKIRDNVRASYNNPENVHTSYNNHDNVLSEYNKPDNVRSKYNNPDTTSYNNPDNVQYSYNNPNNVRSKYNNPDNARTSYDYPDNDRTSYNNPDNVQYSYNNPENIRTGYNNPKKVRPSYNNPENVYPSYNNLENVRTSYNNPNNGRSKYNNPYNNRSRYNNPDIDRTSYNNPDIDRTSYNNPDNDRTRYNNPANVRTNVYYPNNGRSKSVNPDNIRSRYNNPDNDRTRYNNPANVRYVPGNTRFSYDYVEDQDS
ncbi:uncharacterized protein LOC120635126 [Pararge aegeria]|uniref:uncharacterized protein LOC120635126 n=1 Tax=Pararge aegeria TaxID=116150 RepID=UPI0019CFCC17|nr:uncharacterized protein LOC120635126 [Pararge aegeria]